MHACGVDDGTMNTVKAHGPQQCMHALYANAYILNSKQSSICSFTLNVKGIILIKVFSWRVGVAAHIGPMHERAAVWCTFAVCTINTTHRVIYVKTTGDGKVQLISFRHYVWDKWHCCTVVRAFMRCILNTSSPQTFSRHLSVSIQNKDRTTHQTRMHALTCPHHGIESSVEQALLWIGILDLQGILCKMQAYTTNSTAKHSYIHTCI